MFHQTTLRYCSPEVYLHQSVCSSNGTRSHCWMLNVLSTSRPQVNDYCYDSVAFAYDRTNCARYLLWYLKSTISLLTSRTQINEYIKKVGLSVQLGSVNKFDRIPVDQAIEETANRDIEAPGGMKGSVHGPVLSQDTILLLNIYVLISENCGI